MKNFTSFLESRDEDLWWYHYDLILEKTEDEIANVQVKDGRWINLNSGPAQFQFNVEGDDNCSLERCYAVNISGDDHDPFSGVSVAFTRDNKYDDQRLGFGPKVFDGIRKAIYDYIKVRNPAALSWSPIQRTSRPGEGKANTPEARKNAYEIWSLKALWPNLYVSFVENRWIRRDLYDKHFVPKGYPPVPEGIDKDTAPGIKRKALRAFREEAAKHSGSPKENEASQSLSQEYNRARQEASDRRRREEEQLIQDTLNNPQLNPEGLKVGDEVRVEDVDALLNSEDFESVMGSFAVRRVRRMIQDHEMVGVHGQLDRVRVVDGKAVGELTTQHLSLLIPFKFLKKDNEQAKQERERKRMEDIQRKIHSPVLNPQGLKLGDKIIFLENSQYYGAVAQIEKLDYDRHARVAVASIRFLPDEAVLDSARQDITPIPDLNLARHTFIKYTPANVQEIKEKEEEKKRLATRLQNDPRQNPLQLKVGDKVILDMPNVSMGLKGVVAKVTRIFFEDGALVGTLEWIPRESTLVGQYMLSRYGSEMNVTLDRPFLKKYSPEAIEQLRQQYDSEARRQQATATRAATMNTQGHDQGDRVRVTAGPMRNTIGNIDNFRVRNNRTYAILNSPRGPVEVDVALLSPDDMDF